jgi:hypothetical protein
MKTPRAAMALTVAMMAERRAALAWRQARSACSLAMVAQYRADRVSCVVLTASDGSAEVAASE